MSNEGPGGLFGSGGLAEQFFVWNVMAQVASAVIGPFFSDLTYAVNSGHPVVEISAADLADMVVKNILNQGEAAGRAQKWGIANGDFDLMVKDSGEPPGLEFLLEAWRRGFLDWSSGDIDTPSVESGILQSRLKDMWQGTIQKMAVVPIPPSEAVDAVVEGQISYDDGAKLAYYSGVPDDQFRIMVNTRGNPPSLSELLELYRRGFIPAEGTGPEALSFQQGIYEGASKDKWEPLFLRLAEYLPPPRTITTLERTGALTPEQAQQYYRDAGMTPELAAVYSANASGEKMQGSKQLAQGEIESAYSAQLINATEAHDMLAALGYADHEIELLLSYQDLKAALAAVRTATSRVHTLFVGHKIDTATATHALNGLGLPGTAVTNYLSIWELERSANVRTLTAAEITDAFYYQIMDQATATQELEFLGYSAYDAWVMLSVKNKAPLPGQPAQGSAVPVPPLPSQGV